MCFCLVPPPTPSRPSWLGRTHTQPPSSKSCSPRSSPPLRGGVCEVSRRPKRGPGGRNRQLGKGAQAVRGGPRRWEDAIQPPPTSHGPLKGRWPTRRGSHGQGPQERGLRGSAGGVSRFRRRRSRRHRHHRWLGPPPRPRSGESSIGGAVRRRRRPQGPRHLVRALARVAAGVRAGPRRPATRHESIDSTRLCPATATACSGSV